MTASAHGGAADGFRKVAEREIHQGFMIRLLDSTFVSPSGEEFHRDVVATPDAVGIVPVDQEDDDSWSVVLVSQFRSAVEQTLIEIPAGMRDVPGEAPEETAQRELIEEAGYRARLIEPLSSFYPAPGFTTHRTDLVLGIGLDPVSRAADGIEEEYMTILRVPLAEAISMVSRGEITDGKSMVGLLLAEARLRD